MYLTKNRFGAYLICYRDGDGKKHHIYSHTRIKKEACGKFFKFNIPKEPNHKPDYKLILFNKLLHDPRLQQMISNPFNKPGWFR
jgi:hypothetical protein